MTERIIGNQIRLIPYYRNDAVFPAVVSGQGRLGSRK
jgi:hypothetical protein